MMSKLAQGFVAAIAATVLTAGLAGAAIIGTPNCKAGNSGVLCNGGTGCPPGFICNKIGTDADTGIANCRCHNPTMVVVSPKVEADTRQ